MKNYFCFYFFILLSVSSLAQDEKYENVWLLGYGSNNVDTTFGGTRIDFNTEPPAFSYEYLEMNFRFTGTSICNKEGELLFYTNGISIRDFNDEIVANADTLISGPFSSSWANDGIPTVQNVLVLPKPSDENKYSIFQIELIWELWQGVVVRATKLHYHEYQSDLNELTIKNEILITDTLSIGKITATKHANGQDWWVIIPEGSSNRYYKLLLTSQGVTSQDIQMIGDTSKTDIGQGVFSPDGTKYAVSNTGGFSTGQFLDVFDFDRCTGELSNPQRITPDSLSFTGVAFSPNSRFLYVISNEQVQQFDTQLPNYLSQGEIVATYDGFLTPPAPTKFFIAQLAPDGKIYINTPGTTRYLHVINDPDSLGLACNLTQHSIFLPTRNNRSLPNLPNYRLKAAIGSSCDTIRPIAHFSYFTDGLNVSFNDESDRNPNKWFWTFGDGQSSEEQHPIHIYNSSGTYEICLIVSNEGGSDTTCQTVEIVLDNINHVAKEIMYFNFYPNPAKQTVIIQYMNKSKTPMTYIWYDALGNELRNGSLPIGDNSMEIQLDIANWNDGIYFCKIINEQSKLIFTKRLIVIN